MSMTETEPQASVSTYVTLTLKSAEERRSERKSSRRSSSGYYRGCDVPPTIDEEDVEVCASISPTLESAGPCALLRLRPQAEPSLTGRDSPSAAGSAALPEGQRLQRSVCSQSGLCEAGEAGDLLEPGHHAGGRRAGPVRCQAAEQVRSTVSWTPGAAVPR
jgi:hypothetical protein